MEPTPKQIEIVLLVAAGYTSNQIAEMLCLSRLTIDNHRKATLKNSSYVTWCQFMAEMGMSGTLKQWKDAYELRYVAIAPRQKNKRDEEE